MISSSGALNLDFHTTLGREMACSLADSYSYCVGLTKQTAGNFYYSFLSLPRLMKRDMCVLYAFMRHTDDLGDDMSLNRLERKTRLSNWRTAVEQALVQSEFAHPLLVALKEIVQRYQIPTDYLFTVIDGVSMDLEPIEFSTFEELSNYCYHVAGAVGLCCIHIWGYHDDRALEVAIHCGLAFQLTNILRDLAEDAAAGRIYLPRDDMQRFHYTPEQLQAGQINTEFQQLMAFEVQRAHKEYERASVLHNYLEPPGKPVLSAMLKIYGSLLQEIENRNYDVFSQRIHLPKWKKLYYSLSSLAGG